MVGYPGGQSPRNGEYHDRNSLLGFMGTTSDSAAVAEARSGDPARISASSDYSQHPSHIGLAGALSTISIRESSIREGPG